MSTNFYDLQTAVSSVLGANISGVSVRLNRTVESQEAMPSVVIKQPRFELKQELIGGSQYHQMVWLVPLECYAWGQDEDAAASAVGALVSSVTNALRTQANRQLNIGSTVEMTQIVEGGFLDRNVGEAGRGSVGLIAGFGLVLAVTTSEGA